jgi:putative glutathione S-transferase
MFNESFGAFAGPLVDLYPKALRAEIDAWNERIYPSLNNGVYRAGFATTQAAYEEAFHDVFAMLETLEAHLATRQFLVGERLTEADIRLFVTLVRFDVAYYGVFKCNLKRIADYPALMVYLRRMLAVPGVRSKATIRSRRSIPTASSRSGRRSMICCRKSARGIGRAADNPLFSFCE